MQYFDSVAANPVAGRDDILLMTHGNSHRGFWLMENRPHDRGLRVRRSRPTQVDRPIRRLDVALAGTQVGLSLATTPFSRKPKFAGNQ